MQSANWASRKILEQSQAYMDKHEPTQNPVNVSPAFAKRVKMARRHAFRLRKMEYIVNCKYFWRFSMRSGYQGARWSVQND